MKGIFEIVPLIGFLYASGSFIEWQMNPGDWSWMTRTFLVLVIVFIMVIALKGYKQGAGQNPQKN